MLGAADAPTAAAFFALLKADAGGALENACARLASLPASLNKDGGLSLQTLDSALASLTTAAGVGRAGLPPSAGRAAALSAHGYRAEAAALARSGRRDAALLFLGRALEAAGIAAALSALDATYGRGEPLAPARLRRLVAAAAPALLADARAYLGRVADAYTRAAAASAATLAALISVKRTSPPAYRLVGAAARRVDGARMMAAGPPPRPPPLAAARAHSSPAAAPSDGAAAEAALKARLLDLAGGQGTLPLVPPPHVAASAW